MEAYVHSLIRLHALLRRLRLHLVVVLKHGDSFPFLIIIYGYRTDLLSKGLITFVFLILLLPFNYLVF
jgi:hypothetical protein